MKEPLAALDNALHDLLDEDVDLDGQDEAMGYIQNVLREGSSRYSSYAYEKLCAAIADESMVMECRTLALETLAAARAHRYEEGVALRVMEALASNHSEMRWSGVACVDDVPCRWRVLLDPIVGRMAREDPCKDVRRGAAAYVKLTLLLCFGLLV